MNEINTIEYVPKNTNKVIIYVHGLGSDKTFINRFYKQLNDNNIGVIAYDQPCHGDDMQDFINFSLNKCIDYLNKVINYTKEKYNCNIYLFGSSFGGFVILNKLLQRNINKTFLMCPAVNFWDIVKYKTGIDDGYFEKHEYLPMYNNIKIYKHNYLEFKIANEYIKKNKFSNVFVIHGKNDKTVKYSDIVNFCNKSKLKLQIIENGEHELYGYEEEIIRFILENI